MAVLLAACSAAALAQKPQKFGGKEMIGKDLTGWKTRDARNGWRVENGVLINAGPSSDLISEEKFWNFEMEYEYCVPPKGNSGVYLRGRYEIQILDDYGRGTSPGGNGSIYGQTVAKVNASKPAGEWQKVWVKLVGHTVNVKLNDQVIVENVTLTGPTGGALDDKVNEPGPIMLQGDHGPIQFRNIRIKRLPGEPPRP